MTLPPEYRLYAVDQKSLETNYSGQFSTYAVDKTRQAVFQIHKWLDSFGNNERDKTPVGEWSVAERVPVYRGEH